MKSDINIDIKYLAVHGGSGSYFASKNLDDAKGLVDMFNDIAKEYGSPESSRIEIVHNDDLKEHFKELSTRVEIGDAEYLNP